MKDRDCEQCGHEIRLHDESPLVLCGHCQQVADLKAEVDQLRTERNARYEDWMIVETARVNAVAEVERLRKLLHRCWTAVWDWHYGDVVTSIDTKKLLEDMDEFACKPDAAEPTEE